MKTAKTEGNDLGKQQRLRLIENLFAKEGEEAAAYSTEDLLSIEDQQAPFNPEHAKEKVKNQSFQHENEELRTFIKTASKKEQLQEDEPLFAGPNAFLQDTQRLIGASSEQTERIPEEIDLATCQEKGCFQAAIYQKLVVRVIPEEKQEKWICQGHSKEHSYFWKKDAEHAQKKKITEFKKDSTIKEFRVHLNRSGFLGNLDVHSSWTHVDNTQCDHCRMEEVVTQPAKEEDIWETESPERLKALESDPDCSLLYTQIASYPATKVINGVSIFRETWERSLFFSCGGGEGSKCRELRERGGVLVGKQCLKETDQGECLLWEKTYDLGRMAAHQNTSFSFENQDLWGLSEATDSSYEKNHDLPEIAATLEVFSDINKINEYTDSDSRLESAQVFKGESFKCHRSFIKGIIYDCCNKMKGVGLDAKLAKCTSEEKSLLQKRDEGKCRFIGSKKQNLGTETTHIYCCFPTKLSRVLHEQGREQIRIHWGTAEKPQCRGLTLQELQRIDFSQIDFSEVLEDLAIGQEDLKRKITTQIQGIEAIDQSQQIQARTHTAIRPLTQKIEPND